MTERMVEEAERSLPLGSLAALILSFFVGMQGVALLPFWVGASVDTFSLPNNTAGLLATVQLACGAVMTLILASRLQHINSRVALRFGLVGSIGGNALAMLAAHVGSVPLLFTGRGVAGLGEGVVVAVVSAVAANTAKPQQVFASMNVGMAVTSGVVFFVSPGLIAKFGAAALYGIMLAAAAVAALVAGRIPRISAGTSGTGTGGGADAALPNSVRSLAALVGYGLFAVASGGIWAFAQRIGTQSVGLSLPALGRIVSVAAVLMIIGAASAGILGHRIGFKAKIVAFSALLLAVTFLVPFATTEAQFVVGILAYGLVAGFAPSVVPALLATADVTGRAAAASPAFGSIGNAVGPAVMAFALPLGMQFHAISWMALGIITMSVAAFLPEAVAADRKSVPRLAATMAPRNAN